MNLYRVLGLSIAESVHAVGSAVRGLGRPATPVGASEGWAEQFSPASLDDRRARRRVEAMYRAATVRL